MASPSDEIYGTSRIVIHDDKLDEVNRLAAQCVEIVRTKDIGTTEHAHFPTADGKKCFVHEARSVDHRVRSSEKRSKPPACLAMCSRPAAESR